MSITIKKALIGIIGGLAAGIIFSLMYTVLGIFINPVFTPDLTTFGLIPIYIVQWMIAGFFILNINIKAPGILRGLLVGGIMSLFSAIPSIFYGVQASFFYDSVTPYFPMYFVTLILTLGLCTLIGLIPQIAEGNGTLPKPEGTNHRIMVAGVLSGLAVGALYTIFILISTFTSTMGLAGQYASYSVSNSVVSIIMSFLQWTAIGFLIATITIKINTIVKGTIISALTQFFSTILSAASLLLIIVSRDTGVFAKELGISIGNSIMGMFFVIIFGTLIGLVLFLYNKKKVKQTLES